MESINFREATESEQAGLNHYIDSISNTVLPVVITPGLTNGEFIKKTFPKAECVYQSWFNGFTELSYVEVQFAPFCVVTFPIEFWDSSYEVIP